MTEKEQFGELLATQLQDHKISKRHDTCVILHLYYPEMWDKISSHLATLNDEFDLIITIPYNVNISSEVIRKRYSNAQVYRCENRGRDVAPFLAIFSAISDFKYSYVCKIHTKRSLHLENGVEWQEDILSKLLGSRKITSQIKDAFDKHPDWGIVGPQGHVVPHDYFWRQNAEQVIKFASSLDYTTENIDFSYVAGSMFWFRPEALSPLLELDLLTKDFELEQGQIDGTLAHAIERLFGLVVYQGGYKIAESNSRGVKLPESSFQFNLLIQAFQQREDNFYEQRNNLNSRINEQNNKISELNSKINEINDRINELNNKMADKDRELFDIYHSKAWKVVVFLRKLRMLLIPPASWREQIVRRIINRFRSLKLSSEQNKKDKLLLLNFKPKVSIIVPNYNHANFLEKRLDTILNQSYQNFEILILDDCSKDNSREIIIKYAEKHPDKIKYIFNVVNSGKVFRQWRKGIENSTGDLIWICESDDFSETDFLEEIIKYFANLSVNIAFGKIQFSDERGKFRKGLDHYREGAEKGIWSNEIIRPAYKWFSNGFGVNNLIANVGGCVFRRQPIPEAVWEEAETYSVLGDWYLYCHIANGGMIAYTPEAVSYFRQHGENTSVSSFSNLPYYLEHQRLMETLKRFWDIPNETVEKFVQKVEFQYNYFQLEKKFGAFDKHINKKILQDKRKEKLHILMGILGFSSGGGELFPIHLANELQKSDCIVSLFVYDISAINQDMYDALNKGIAVYTSSFVQKLGVEKFIEDAGVSIIHSHMISVDVFFFIQNRVTLDIPYLVTLHGSYDSVPSPEHTLKDVVEGVDYWGYTADKNLDILKSFQISQDKFVKFSNAMPVDKEDFPMSRKDLGITEDAVIFTFVARGIRSKGWEVAILAFNQLRNENPDIPMHLLLCGDGEETTRCQNLYGDDPDITFLGYQPRINGLYRISDCALVPTRFKGESYPLILIQAVQEGLPIIATDIGEIKNMIIDSNEMAGILIENVEDTTKFTRNFKNAMCEMLNPNTRSYFQKIAIKIEEKHNMQNVANQYLDFYKKMTKAYSKELIR